MRRVGLTVSGYLVRTIVPYFIFVWLLLSVILFVQQASRFSDIFFSANIPATLVWQLMLALVPNVIAFTCPMAILVGTVIGLSKMQGDSELVALRAAGVGNLQITVPLVILGIFLSGFAFLINIKGVPLASALVRRVALQTAIKKLESPVEPGIFNTEIAGYTIFVRSGDITSGRWQDIFVYQKDADSGGTRIITSGEGRIDVSDQISELVLENANVLTLPATDKEGKYVSERIGDVRFAIKTRRNELIERMSTAQSGLEEMGLSQLADYAASKEGSERREAQILWQRRVMLSVTPLIFCVIGAAMVLRLNRGGRGFGVFLSLAALIIYYLLAFLGEQLIRVGNVSAIVGGLFPIAVSLAIILWLYLSPRTQAFGSIFDWLRSFGRGMKTKPKRMQARNLYFDLTAGLRDIDLLTNLAKYFLFAMAFTGAIFYIFTAFELWKFAGTMDGGIPLLIKYLIYLTPFVYLQLAPTCAMIAILTTYIIKSRNNELVTWISAGQSVYRLLIPCFVACLALGLANWFVQETVLPTANRLQDETRTQIRSRGTVANQGGRYWIARDNSIYSFELATSASDNEKERIATNPDVIRKDVFASDNVKRLRLFFGYSFGEGGKLQSVYRSDSAIWAGNEIRFDGSYQQVEINDAGVTVENLAGGSLPAATMDLAGFVGKPSHLSASQLSQRIDQSESETEKRLLTVSLYRRYTTVLLPLVIGLLAAPFGLNLSRKGKVLMSGYAVALWLVFIGVSSAFEQMGQNGLLAPILAVWAPLVLFALIGLYLLSKVRT